MIASPARRLGAVGLALAALAAGVPAAAQDAPIQLHRPPAAAPMRPATPPPPVTVAPRPTGGSAVQVETLQAVDANAVGVIDERRGGFGIDMWSGSQRTLVQKLLPGLPATAPSPTMRSMMRRLLLSTAAVPEGEVPAGPSLLSQRIERLWAMGDVDGMLALIAAAPSAEARQMALLRLDGLLLKGDAAAACAELAAAREAAGAAGDGYLNKVAAFCHVKEGRPAEAELAVAWLRERGHLDSAFFPLIDALLGLPAPELETLPEPKPLYLAMLREAERQLPADAAGGEHPAILRAVALSVNAPAEARLIAAEKAEWIGVLDTEILRQLYAGTTFTDEEADRPLDDAAQDAGVRSRALLFRAAQLQKGSIARAEVIGKAFALARRHGHFVQAARLYAPLIAEMTPSAEIAPLAGDAVRALLAAGMTDRLGPWLALCESAGRVAGPPVWPLLRLTEAHEDDPPGPGALRAWLDQRAKQPADAAARQAAVLFGLFDALGDRLGSDDWLALMDGPPRVTVPMPQPALWHAQRIAAEDLRLGETLLLSLVSIGPGGPGDLEPASLYRVIASLRLVGFDAEARALALEAALAHGV